MKAINIYFGASPKEMIWPVEGVNPPPEGEFYSTTVHVVSDSKRHTYHMDGVVRVERKLFNLLKKIEVLAGATLAHHFSVALVTKFRRTGIRTIYNTGLVWGDRTFDGHYLQKGIHFHGDTIHYRIRFVDLGDRIDERRDV